MVEAATKFWLFSKKIYVINYSTQLGNVHIFRQQKWGERESVNWWQILTVNWGMKERISKKIKSTILKNNLLVELKFQKLSVFNLSCLFFENSLFLSLAVLWTIRYCLYSSSYIFQFLLAIVYKYNLIHHDNYLPILGISMLDVLESLIFHRFLFFFL